MARTRVSPNIRRSARNAVRHNDSTRSREAQQNQASAAGIRDWNAQVNDRYAKTHDTKVITGVLYPVSSGRARPIRLPCFRDPGDAPRSTGFVDDVRVSPWFPDGSVYTRIHNVPGTTLTLQNDYTVITCRYPRRAPRNQAVDACLSAHTRGNIIVFRHHHRYHMSLTNVHSSERRLIDHAVRQYVLLIFAGLAIPLNPGLDFSSVPVRLVEDHACKPYESTVIFEPAVQAPV